MSDRSSLEDMPKWTSGLCYICGRQVNTNTRDKTRGTVINYGGKITYEHVECARQFEKRIPDEKAKTEANEAQGY